MEPRIRPISLADAEPPARRILEGFSRLRGDDATVLNVFGTLATHPQLFERWLTFANYILTESTLEPRLRELVILRTGWRCRSPYEFAQHVIVGRSAGCTDAEIARVAEGPDAGGWTPLEAAALRAADDLYDHDTIVPTTWAALAEHLDERQILDVVFTVGQYTLVSYALNAVAVARDDGLDDPAIPMPPAANDGLG
jgi:4-carboxymuconolactone decarboxylase